MQQHSYGNGDGDVSRLSRGDFLKTTNRSSPRRTGGSQRRVGGQQRSWGSKVHTEDSQIDQNNDQSSTQDSNFSSYRDEYIQRSSIDCSGIKIVLNDLRSLPLDQLKEKAASFEIESSRLTSKNSLVFDIALRVASSGGVVEGGGIVETMKEEYAFLRSIDYSYVQSRDDIYIPRNIVVDLKLRSGDFVYGTLKQPRYGERYFCMNRVLEINGDRELGKSVRPFDEMQAVYPNEKIELEFDASDLGTRVIDMISPIGKGQRALIVAPPRTGKTRLLKSMAHAINANHPEIHLIVLLIDERPEEVTDIKECVKGEVISSTFDESASRHVCVAEMTIERAKRLLESGDGGSPKHVVILLDSITRLARAYNNVVPSSGKVLTGGFDANAMQWPKRIFGAARCTSDNGSLTIIATALVDTGSKMDEVIFEEFKGTGNCEIVLDRAKLFYPAINVKKSGTRNEELLLSKANMSKVWILRRILSPMGAEESMEFLYEKMSNCKMNEEFFEKMMGQS